MSGRKKMTPALLLAGAILAAPAPAGSAPIGDYPVETVAMTAAGWAAAGAPSRGPARSVGGYAGGCLQGAVALPPDGPGYQVLRLSRKRNFGHPALVRYLEDLGRTAEKHGLGVLMIADMSQPRGGPMPNGHASHQIGLDADIWLRLDQPRLSRSERETPTAINYVDYAGMQVKSEFRQDRQAALIRLAASDSRIARLFVNPVIKQQLCRDPGPGDHAWLAKVRPWYGHDSHAHVRLACPADSADCADQKPFPPGDGCGEELDWWLNEASRPVTPKPPGEEKPRVAKLPKACQAILKDNSRGVRPAAYEEPAHR